MNVAELLIKYRADVSNAVAGIDQVDKTADRSTKAVAQKFEKLQSKLDSIGTKMSLALTAPLALVGRSALKAAMDAVESENLFTVSMGKMATSARAWSESLNKSLGLNSYELRKNVSMYNVMFQSMGLGEQAAYDMSKGLTQLAYDMASFYNLAPEEAFEKLSAGMTGEMEPLKRLGILVSETAVKNYALTHGMLKQGEQLSETGKVLARYGVILDSTSKAQGDLARTIQSPTNQLRQMQEQVNQLTIEIGTEMIPIFSKLIAAAKDGITWFAGLNKETKYHVTVLGMVVAAAGPTVIALNAIIKAVVGLKTAIIACSTATLSLGTKLKGLVALVTGSTFAAVVATIAGLAGVNILRDKIEDRITKDKKLPTYRDPSKITTANISQKINELKTKREQYLERVGLGGMSGPMDSWASIPTAAQRKVILNYDRQIADLEKRRKQASEVKPAPVLPAIPGLGTIQDAVKGVTKSGKPVKFTVPKSVADKAAVETATKTAVPVTPEAALADINKKIDVNLAAWKRAANARFVAEGAEMFRKYGELSIRPDSGLGKRMAEFKKLYDARSQDLYRKKYSNSAWIAKNEVDEGERAAKEELNALQKEGAGDEFGAGLVRARAKRDVELSQLERMKQMGEDVTNRIAAVKAAYHNEASELMNARIEQIKTEEEEEQRRTLDLAEQVNQRIGLIRQETNQRIIEHNRWVDELKRNSTGTTDAQGLNRRLANTGLGMGFDGMYWALPNPDAPMTGNEIMAARQSIEEDNKMQQDLLKQILDALRMMGGRLAYE